MKLGSLLLMVTLILSLESVFLHRKVTIQYAYYSCSDGENHLQVMQNH